MAVGYRKRIVVLVNKRDFATLNLLIERGFGDKYTEIMKLALREFARTNKVEAKNYD